jgi:hypothetical protein
VALCSRPIAATRLANFHLVWLSTGTFCLNVWKLLLSRMPQNVQQHQILRQLASMV